MNYPYWEHRSLASVSSYVVGAHERVLSRISDPCVSLSLWQRPAELLIAKELAQLTAAQLSRARHLTSPTSFDDDLSAMLTKHGLDPEAFSHLRADLRHLATLFFPLADTRPVRLRLTTTDADDCRRFHVDRTYLRLLCTYQGPGTEWLRNEQVDRQALMCGDPNEAIIRFGTASRFETFWVGITRGDPQNLGQGLVHRSPPIAGTGQIRVLFCLEC
ncbi:MAG: DUF1826 domain-containing protein [Pseudomonadota bacterium]